MMKGTLARRTSKWVLAFLTILPTSLPARSPLELEAQQFPTRILATHNAERAALGLAPLVWDDRLGVQAAQYAFKLATSRRFAHSVPSSRGPTGENLWMGTRRAFSIEKMVANWSSERRLFKPGIFPAISRTGSWHEVGHYTQMVWPATRRVGCALASNAGEDYLVCRYFPAGNVHGQALRPQSNFASYSAR